MIHPLYAALTNLEGALQRAQLWDDLPPAPEDLASTLPFCMDTLSFAQWLQFVCVPRLRQMLYSNHPLPTAMALYPMATETYRDDLIRYSELLEAVADLDWALTGQVQRT